MLIFDVVAFVCDSCIFSTRFAHTAGGISTKPLPYFSPLNSKTAHATNKIHRQPKPLQKLQSDQTRE